jgi:hypothetical protein
MKKLILNGAVVASVLCFFSGASFAMSSGVACMMSSVATDCAPGKPCLGKEMIKAAKPDAAAALAGAGYTETLKQAIEIVTENAKGKNISITVEDAIKIIALSE